MLFDSHCHLTDDRFADDLDEVLGRAREAGVTRLVTIASDLADARRAIALARAHDDVRATAGIHPHAAESADADAWPALEKLAGAPEVVALGETGLDYYYDNSPAAVQRACFERHLDLADALGLPVVVHSREADADTVALLRAAAPGVSGVLHCFAGGPQLLEAGIELGWYVSFSGLVTFKSYDGASLVRRVPDDRLLVETDSPYLAPVPRRGRRNEPAFVRHVVDAVAALRSEDPDETARTTSRNAARFYGLVEQDAAPSCSS